MDFSDVVNDTVFVSHKEVKIPSRHRGERFYLKFYLIDDCKREVLAATAEDQGDAHYRYKNAHGFNQYGKLDSQKRKDVIMWLEKIIKESKEKHGKQDSEECSKMMIKTDDHPDGLYFTRETQEHVVLSDGRRATKWFLIDQHGDSHLAVVGEENYARDGHYIYIAQEPFSQYAALECKNKAGVYHWLELWIRHDADDGSGPCTPVQRGPNRLSRRKQPRPVVLELGDCETERCRPGVKRRPHRLVDVLSLYKSRYPPVKTMMNGGAPAKRQKTSGGDLDSKKSEKNLEPKWLRELREEAAQKAYQRRTSAVRSLSWLKEVPAEDDIKNVQYWHDILKEMISRWERGEVENKENSGEGLGAEMDCEGGSGGEGANSNGEPHSNGNQVEAANSTLVTYPDRHWLRLCLEAIKEIGSMYMPLKLMAETGVLHTVLKLRGYPNKTIARYASYVADDWRQKMISNVKVLANPIFLQDPLQDFEGKLSKGELHPREGPVEKQAQNTDVTDTKCTVVRNLSGGDLGSNADDRSRVDDAMNGKSSPGGDLEKEADTTAGDASMTDPKPLPAQSPASEKIPSPLLSPSLVPERPTFQLLNSGQTESTRTDTLSPLLLDIPMECKGDQMDQIDPKNQKMDQMDQMENVKLCESLLKKDNKQESGSKVPEQEVADSVCSKGSDGANNGTNVENVTKEGCNEIASESMELDKAEGRSGKKERPVLIGEKERPSSLQGRIASKELPGSGTKNSDRESESLSLALEDLPDDFVIGGDGSGVEDGMNQNEGAD